MQTDDVGLLLFELTPIKARILYEVLGRLHFYKANGKDYDVDRAGDSYQCVELDGLGYQAFALDSLRDMLSALDVCRIRLQGLQRRFELEHLLEYEFLSVDGVKCIAYAAMSAKVRVQFLHERLLLMGRKNWNTEMLCLLCGERHHLLLWPGLPVLYSCLNCRQPMVCFRTCDGSGVSVEPAIKGGMWPKIHENYGWEGKKVVDKKEKERRI